MRHLKTTFLLLPLALLAACDGGGPKADAYGNFETDELTVSAETAGKILEFNVEEGEHLEAGKTIAIIDTTQLFLKKKQMEASMAAIRKKLPNEAAQLAVFDERIIKLNDEVARLTKLVKANAAPSKQLDDLQAELLVTQTQKNAMASSLGTQTLGMLSELEPMRFQLLQIEDQLKKSHVINPINGMVLTTLVKANELAMAGKALYRIAAMNPLVLRAYVSGDMLGQVKIGNEVTVKTDGPNGTLVETTGTVTWISSEAEFTPKIIQTKDERITQVYAMKIDVPNDGALKIGMPAEVTF